MAAERRRGGLLAAAAAASGSGVGGVRRRGEVREAAAGRGIYIGGGATPAWGRGRRGGVAAPDSGGGGVLVPVSRRETATRDGPAWLGWASAQSGAGIFFLKKIYSAELKNRRKINKKPKMPKQIFSV